MIDLDNWFRDKQTNYEETKLRELWNACGLTASEIRNLARQAKQEESIGFGWFNSRFPHFPIAIETRKLAHPLTLDQLFSGHESRVELWKWFRETQANWPAANAVGLVFDRRGDGIPDLIAHDLSATWLKRGPRFASPDAYGRENVITTWSLFLDALKDAVNEDGVPRFRSLLLGSESQ